MAGSAIAPQVKVAATAAESAATCAQYIAQQLKEALAAKGRAMFAISGGNTPKAMFHELALAGLDWSKIHLFWVDERCVPPTSDSSNYKMAGATLIGPAKIPDVNVHRIYGELPPEEGAKRYREEIARVFGIAAGEIPVFDVLHRGIGDDAHTASLFPGEPLIEDRTHVAANVWVEKMNMHRVTLLPAVLLAAENTIIQAEGASKAEPIYQVLYGPDDPMRFPCQLATRGSDRAVWFVDEPAAAKVKDR